MNFEMLPVQVHFNAGRCGWEMGLPEETYRDFMPLRRGSVKIDTGVGNWRFKV